MRTLRTLALALVVLLLPLAAVDPAHAACGDAIKQAGEACDGSATGGDTACPGACLAPPLIGQCTCAVPTTDARTYTILGESQIRLGGGTTVVGGNVGVTNSGGYLLVSKDTTLPASGQAIGDRSKVVGGSSLGRLFSNNANVHDDAAVLGGGPFPFAAPLTLTNVAAFPSITPGTVDITVAEDETVHLPPGAYGKITVAQSGRLFLRGFTPGTGVGRYVVASIKMAFEGRINADNAVVINVRDRIGMAGQTYLGPTAGEPLQAGDVLVNVAGPAAKISRGATLAAYLRVPDGKIGIGSSAAITGRLVGAKISIAKKASVTRQGSCGDGVKAPVEECDTSAPNGDTACPGDCIAGDPQGQGRIELGQQGQCRCRCESNAECNDNNACNGVETCQGGVCVPGAAPECDDNNVCTRDCDPQQGCVHQPVEDGHACSDDNLCTRNDFCQNGTCKTGELRDCTDDNSCTTDTCVPATGCVRTPLNDGHSCTDSNACTQGDACIRGACVGGLPPSCEDQNPCTVGSCDALAGCKQTNVTNGTGCAGTSPCTVQDSCQEGACTSGVSTLCNDSNPCTADTCTVVGPPGMQTAQCNSTTLPDFTPCGANGLVCFFGVCR
ncbi:MAG TPA: hypothetical protein VGR62_11125 [Candidatus Binatia bacterium]|jgi:hypothetical protein|nr:hypothetical protein [Candidatus Binatia bacterium]